MLIKKVGSYKCNNICYGKLHLPTKYIGKHVLISILTKNELKEYNEKLKEQEIKLQNHLNKLKKIRDKRNGAKI